MLVPVIPPLFDTRNVCNRLEDGGIDDLAGGQHSPREPRSQINLLVIWAITIDIRRQ